MNKVDVRGVEIAYRIDGDGAPTRPWLVFAHSLACDHRMWMPQIDAFARACNVLSYDIRGHGQSAVPPPPYTLDQLANDLRGLLDALRIERCHFIGLSLGGMIGQVAALRFPLRFASLTLADTTSRYPSQMRPMWDERIAQARRAGMEALVSSTLQRWFTPAFLALQPERIGRIGAQIRATPVAGYIGCAQAIAGLDLTARLSNIDCPTLVIVGEEDRGTPLDMAEEIARSIARARLQRIAAAAHLSNIEQPHEFNAALRNFLADAL